MHHYFKLDYYSCGIYNSLHTEQVGGRLSYNFITQYAFIVLFINQR
jgi:hypothetical protein